MSRLSHLRLRRPPGRRRCWGSASVGPPPPRRGFAARNVNRAMLFLYFPALTGKLLYVLLCCQGKAWSCLPLVARADLLVSSMVTALMHALRFCCITGCCAVCQPQDMELLHDFQSAAHWLGSASAQVANACRPCSCGLQSVLNACAWSQEAARHCFVSSIF